MSKLSLSPTAISLEFALVRYKNALNKLDDLHLHEISITTKRERILEVLLARDSLQNSLKNQERLSVKNLSQVIQFDLIFKQKSHKVNQILNLPECRKIFPVDHQSWWWNLDSRDIFYPWHRFDWLFKGLRVAAWTGNLALLVDIITRFASGVAGIAGAFAVAAPSLLTLLKAKGELTEAGQEGFERLMIHWKVPLQFREIAKLGATLLLSGFLIIFWTSAPEFFNRYGIQSYSNGNIETAERNFLRAIALNPDHVDAHYNLGNIYEDKQDLDKALKHYRVAIIGGVPEAYNNLAHIYIKKQEYFQAAKLLNQGLFQAGNQKSQPEIRYSIFKNLGWIRFEQGRDHEAQQYLQTAIGIASRSGTAKYIRNRGSAHCLLAQVMERQKQPSAIDQWQQCCQYSSILNPNEDDWLYQAHKRLKEAEKLCKKP